MLTKAGLQDLAQESLEASRYLSNIYRYTEEGLTALEGYRHDIVGE